MKQSSKVSIFLSFKLEHPFMKISLLHLLFSLYFRNYIDKRVYKIIHVSLNNNKKNNRNKLHENGHLNANTIPIYLFLIM